MQLPATTSVAPTLVIGDVHGCADELARLLEIAPAERVVLVGDLYTKGPDPAGVWRLIRDRGLEAVLGNHDARLIDVLDGRRPKDAHGHEVVATLDAEDPAWRDHLRGLPTVLKKVGDGWTVVHAGLHPSGKLSRTPEAMRLSVRLLPRKLGGQLWWRAYTGDRKVIFGHDAKRGFVRVERAGRPVVVGLDTGCCYGGALTAFLPESDTVVHVPAARVYQSVGRE